MLKARTYSKLNFYQEALWEGHSQHKEGADIFFKHNC